MILIKKIPTKNTDKMKFLFSLFLSLFLILIFSISSSASEVSFWGKIKNHNSDAVDFILHNNYLLQEDNIYRAKINEQNEFSVMLSIDRPQIVQIKVDEKILYLFASPKTNRIEFEYDNNAPSATLTLKGKNVFNNSFYNSFSRSFDWNNEKKETYEMGGLSTQVSPKIKQMAVSYSMYDYFKIIDQNRNNQLQYLQNSSSLSIDFYRFIENEINWKYETHKIAYFLFNKDRFSISDFKKYWVRYALLQTVNINDDKVIAFPDFQNMLSAFIHFLHLQTPVKTKISDSFYTFIEVNLRGKPRYFMLAKLMVSNFQNAGNPTLAIQHLKAFKRENPYPEYNTILNQIFGKDLEFLTNKNAPNIKVLDLSEQELWLNQYAGKVVYVSFWASWCAPCLQGFQHTKNFRKEMEKNGVVFLNINIDDKEQVWRKTLAHREIVGKNVYALDVKQAKEELKITSLPYYFLVNKYGKIVYLSSNKLTECREDFLQLLNE
ncbi:MAG TPA: redoxin domain-containing protein [Phaeodactylibacter sp.]|nr:redoxin domain-containing protein [Phaeodactylibacter sp.]